MENKYLKNKINIINGDAEYWDNIKLSSIGKEELKAELAEKEIINGYIHSIECLYYAFEIEKSPCRGLITFRTNQVLIPLLYACRHSIELSIKYYINKNNIQKHKGHNLKELYNNLDKNKREELKEYNMLVETLSFLDDDGCKFRYSNDAKGNQYKNEPEFINTALLTKDVIDLCNKLVK